MERLSELISIPNVSDSSLTKRLLPHTLHSFSKAIVSLRLIPVNCNV